MADRIDEAWAALGGVFDPETEINIVDLGLVYDVRERGDAVEVIMTFTDEGCPAGPLLVEAVRRATAEACAGSNVAVTVTFEPRWTPTRITPAGRAMLQR